MTVRLVFQQGDEGLRLGCLQQDTPDGPEKVNLESVQTDLTKLQLQMADLLALLHHETAADQKRYYSTS